MPAPRIHYLVPDYDRPSWGIAMLYEHVALLRELGHDARVLHERAPFRIGWYACDVPVAPPDALDSPPAAGDLLVVPEVSAARAATLDWPCRRWVFVQGSFLVESGLGGAAGYRELGFERALAVLPFVAEIVERHYGLAAALVPPFVAPGFFLPDVETRPRSPTILLAVKPEYGALGAPDRELFLRVVNRELAARPANGWRVEELHGLSHAAVAARMADATFLVCLNTHEAFNTAVPEAMAAGCVVLCYDAVGGTEFLVDGENAWVFPNHHLWPLIGKLLALLDPAPEREAELGRLRAAARRTAERFTRAATRAALAAAFAPG